MEVEKEDNLAKREEVFDEALGKDVISPLPLPARILSYLLIIFFAFSGLYFFLIAIETLGDAFKLIAGVNAGEIFVGNDNPIVGLMIGILATVLVQSSSTTTSIITVLVGDGIIPFPTAIPMIMGANIGTSVTNTIVAFSLGTEHPLAYERAFAGGTVHDMFNYLNVLVLLPVELIVDLVNPNGGGMLEIISGSMVPDEFSGEDKPENKIKEWTEKIKTAIVSTNKEVIFDIAKGRPSADDCINKNENFSFKFSNKKFKFTPPGETEEESLKIQYCLNGEEFANVLPQYGDEANPNNLTALEFAQKLFDEARLLKGGLFFENGKSDSEAGILLLFLSLFMLIGALTIIVKSLSFVVRGPGRKYMQKALNFDLLLPPVFHENVILRALNVGGWLSIAAGAGITFFVQSSSITTSVLTPMVAADLLTIENMYPFTLGANIGTTTTAIIAAIHKQKPEGLQIAYVHLLFNIIGVLIWFPLPFMRQIPLNMAKFLGKLTYVSRFAPLVYIFVAFLIYPGFFFGISAGFSSPNAGGKVAAVIVLLLVVLSHAFLLFVYLKRGGREKFLDFVHGKKVKKLGPKGTKNPVGELERPDENATLDAHYSV